MNASRPPPVVVIYLTTNSGPRARQFTPIQLTGAYIVHTHNASERGERRPASVCLCDTMAVGGRRCAALIIGNGAGRVSTYHIPAALPPTPRPEYTADRGHKPGQMYVCTVSRLEPSPSATRALPVYIPTAIV